jgi:hypothetical protein
VRLATLLLTLAVAGLTAAKAVTSRPAQRPEARSVWEIRVETSGGFAGTGRGSVALSSEGDVTVVRSPMRPREASPNQEPCRGRLGEDELQGLARAIETAAPAGWRLPGLERAAPDAYRYRFTLRLGEGPEAHAATWYDNTADLLPEDLAAIYQLAAEVWNRVAQACGPR